MIVTKQDQIVVKELRETLATVTKELAFMRALLDELEGIDVEEEASIDSGDASIDFFSYRVTKAHNEHYSFAVLLNDEVICEGHNFIDEEEATEAGSRCLMGYIRERGERDGASGEVQRGET